MPWSGSTIAETGASSGAAWSAALRHAEVLQGVQAMWWSGARRGPFLEDAQQAAWLERALLHRHRPSEGAFIQH